MTPTLTKIKELCDEALSAAKYLADIETLASFAPQLAREYTKLLMALELAIKYRNEWQSRYMGCASDQAIAHIHNKWLAEDKEIEAILNGSGE